MKLSAADAARLFKAPPAGLRGLLIHGADAAQVATMRDRAVAALAGPDAGADMRLERIEAAKARADAGAVDAALRAQGFFPGVRVVMVLGAADGLAERLAAALTDAATPEALLLVTADALPAKSKLRAAFEKPAHAAALALYDDPPDRASLERMVRQAGAASVAPDALDALLEVCAAQSRAAAERLCETLGLYAHGAALEAEGVQALAPTSAEADLDAPLDAALAGDGPAARRALARLAARGAQPVSIAIAAQRRLRALHRAAVGGSAFGLGPPRARDRALAAARRLGPARLERALCALLETDAALRGGRPGAPQAAQLERALLRLAAEAAR